MTALSLALMLGRVAYTGQLTHVHLAWNLFLAWLPLGLAYLAFQCRATSPPLRTGFGLAWLLFLPNAPYLVTDLMHLPWGSGIPILYDVVMLFSAAMCGLLLGLVSLQWMVSYVARGTRVWIGHTVRLVVLGLTGFGIYVGRYLGWNSWDVLANPAPLAREVWAPIRYPVQHWQAWAFVALFATLLVLAYELLGALGRRTPTETGG